MSDKEVKRQLSTLEKIGIIATILACCFGAIALIPAFVSMFQSFRGDPNSISSVPLITPSATFSATTTTHINPTQVVLQPSSNKAMTPTEPHTQLLATPQSSETSAPKVTTIPTATPTTRKPKETATLVPLSAPIFCNSNLGEVFPPIDNAHSTYKLSLPAEKFNDFVFELGAYQSVRFAISADFPPTLAIYDADTCKELVNNDNLDQYTNEKPKQLDFIPNVAGRYFLRVGGYYHDSSGLYTLTRRDNPLQVPQPPNSQNDVTRDCSDAPVAILPMINTENPIYQVSLPSTQAHDYGFELDAYQSVRFAVSADFPPTLGIYNAATCEQLVSNGDLNPYTKEKPKQLDFVPNVAGSYFVRVGGYYHDSSGLYTLTFRQLK